MPFETPIATPQSTPVSVSQTPIKESHDIPTGDIINLNNLMDYFRVEQKDRTDENIVDDMQGILDWALLQKEKPTLADIFSFVQSLETKLSAPPAGTTRYKQVSNWIQINSQIAELEKKRKIYESNW